MTSPEAARTPAARTRTLVVVSVIAALSGLGLALPSVSAAATLSWGSNLSVTPTVDTTTIAPDGSDLALWNTQASAGPTAPSGGQVLGVKIRGCAIETSGAPTTSGGVPLNTIGFQALAKQSDGSYNFDSPSAGMDSAGARFTVPFCSNSNNPADTTAAVNTSTVSSFEPVHLCIKAGDALAFVDIGGYSPQNPHGVPFDVISRNTGSALASYPDAAGASSYSNPGAHPDEELMLQAVEGTGPDAYALCPGGTACQSPSSNMLIPCGGGGGPTGGSGGGGGSGGSGGGGGSTGSGGGGGGRYRWLGAEAVARPGAAAVVARPGAAAVVARPGAAAVVMGAQPAATPVITRAKAQPGSLLCGQGCDDHLRRHSAGPVDFQGVQAREGHQARRRLH